jgi:uncharacterized protein DUF6065
MSADARERTAAPELIAFHTSPRVPVPIAPAPLRREWMDETRNRWAYKCLPLVVANEAGWFLLNEFRFEAVWSGEDDPASIAIEFFDSKVRTPAPVRSYFGYGVLTWTVPYLFRTPPGYNLLARGPSNWPKDGISELEIHPFRPQRRIRGRGAVLHDRAAAAGRARVVSTVLSGH